MKRIISICLCALLALAFCGVSGLAEGETAARDSLTVGSLTKMSGMFFTDCWGNNTADMDVRALLHGYQTVAMQKDGLFSVDPTVCAAEYSDDAAGNRTYTFEINPDLAFSDGTPVTARDYAFSVLLQSGQEMLALGGSNQAYGHLVGFEAYAAGEGSFSGVRLLGAHEFSLTVKAEYLPFFYELMLVNVTPYPMHVIAPDCDVYDDGNGAYITAIPDTDGAFGVEVLEKTILDPETGYRTHPSVVSGPYALTSYEDGVAEFARNDRYLGNFEGQKPAIARLTFRQVMAETMLDELASGEVDVLNKVSSGDSIRAGMDMVARDEARAASYLRTGFAFLSFACEQQPTSSLAVRRAVMMCVDRDALAQDYLRGYGMPVYGYYGYGQWMAVESQEELVELNRYPFDLDAARELLIGDGWVLNESGDAFNAATDEVRCKDIDGTITPLEIRWAKTADSEAANIIEVMLTNSFRAVGIGLTVTEMPYDEMSRRYYRQDDRSEYNLFFLASNFGLVFNPAPAVSADAAHQGVYNTTGIADAALEAAAKALNGTEGGDVEGYRAKWLDFQEKWVEVLPMAPLYSNGYVDFHAPDLYGYDVNANWSWASAILYASFDAPIEAEEGTVVIED